MLLKLHKDSAASSSVELGGADAPSLLWCGMMSISFGQPDGSVLVGFVFRSAKLAYLIWFWSRDLFIGEYVVIKRT